MLETLPTTYRRDLSRELARQRALAPREFSQLPPPVRSFVAASGHGERTRAQHARIAWGAMRLRSARDARWLSVTCEQVSFFAEPTRLALLQSRLAGVLPFSGYDRYLDGEACFFMNLAGVVPLRRARGAHMDDSALVTHLSEAMMMPPLWADPRIEWLTLDERSVRARLRHGQRCVHGVFTFGPEHAWVRFETEDRWRDGREPTRERWLAEVSDFRWRDGLRVPTRASASWDGRGRPFVYMQGEIDAIRYDSERAQPAGQPAPAPEPLAFRTARRHR